jgi:hypothetical protein
VTPVQYRLVQRLDLDLDAGVAHPVENRSVSENEDPPRDDDRNEEAEGTPVPDPEEEQGTARDDPQAD